MRQVFFCLQVNVDSSVRESTNQRLRLGLGPASFQPAQDQVFSLMETDSYPRFLRSRLYKQLANQSAETPDSYPRFLKSRLYGQLANQSAERSDQGRAVSQS